MECQAGQHRFEDAKCRRCGKEQTGPSLILPADHWERPRRNTDRPKTWTVEVTLTTVQTCEVTVEADDEETATALAHDMDDYEFEVHDSWEFVAREEDSP